MNNLVTLPIEELHYREDARHRSDEALAALADSIDQMGLINPIRVRKSVAGYEVIAGAHRLQACGLLSWHEVPCLLVEDDDLRAELAMIDENLVRAELSPADRAQQTARRKAIYLELHPETAAHVSGAYASNRAQGNASAKFAPAFTTETAKVTGQSERTVQLYAERGEKVGREALDLIRGTKLDTGTYLDKLKRVEPSEQPAVVRRDLSSLPQERHSNRATSPTAGPQLMERFIELVDRIEAIPIPALVTSAGPRRAVLNQRASGLADRMDEILGGEA